MAEINGASPANAGAKAGVRKSKKLSTRIDLTPMVDLGFLLITFFMVSSKWAEAKAAELFMPKETNEHPNNVCESCALTVIPGGDNKVFYYHGSLENAMRNGDNGLTSFSLDNGIGQIIREKQSSLMKKGIKVEDLMLIIKPTEDAAYGNIVDLLDEVLINDVKHYAIVNLDQGERQTLKTKGLLF